MYCSTQAIVVHFEALKFAAESINIVYQEGIYIYMKKKKNTHATIQLNQGDVKCEP